jgi:hypothetical protein
MRILELHNLQRLTGGVDRHIAWQEAGLRARGHECETWFLSLHEAVESFRPDLVHVHTPFPLMSPAAIRTLERTRRAHETACR